MKNYILFVFFTFWLVGVGFCQNAAQIREYAKEYLTYPFSDPNPIPPDAKLYPYFRFDGFSTTGEVEKWKVVELENDYIKVLIFPEIGGKIWTAFDKKTGKAFLYNNEVVKFRDIALRGPWVSGGIEFNYGIIGHTPNSATPADYLLQENEDGSVSYFSSTLDLLTRTQWVIEVKLEKDKAYFTTQSYWFNPTGIDQPYYTWMNAAIPVGRDLEFLYPGNQYLSHGGEAHTWPVDSEGRNLSNYNENAFGGSKSYHVFGLPSNYFGGLWQTDDFGMIHFADRDAKLGKKIFLWAQSEEGRIWEDLLTDPSGQYVEIQSGRLFNQNVFESSLTPFKQIGFQPYSSDSWTEYWYPFRGLKGFKTANQLGAFNFSQQNDKLTVQVSATQAINDKITVFAKDGTKLAEQEFKISPLETKSIEFEGLINEKPYVVEINGERIGLVNQESEQHLNRPTKIDKDFDSESAYGLYLQGRDLYRFRNYKLAEQKIEESLKKEPLFVPSLVEMAKLQYNRMDYSLAYDHLQKALSIDTYHPEANFMYGQVSSALNQKYDAVDGFEVASLSPHYRTAAYTALSKLYLKDNKFKEAEKYAAKSIKENPQNSEAFKLLTVLNREKGKVKTAQELKNRLLALNPLDHFIRFEDYLENPDSDHQNKFQSLIRNEFPEQSYLELAIWYASLNKWDEAVSLIDLSPHKNALHWYWMAWLTDQKGDSREASQSFLKKADGSKIDFVFPFRQESQKVLEWAIAQTASWKATYLRALLEEFKGNDEKAFDFLQSLKKVDFAPFYVVRARLNKMGIADQIKDVKTAIKLDSKQWRYHQLLSRFLLKNKEYKEAVKVLEKAYSLDPSNYIIGLDLIEAYSLNGEYLDAETLLAQIEVLPFEGANEAKQFYRRIKLLLAYKAFEQGAYELALKKIDEAEEWPANLGVGKPYENRINNQLEKEFKVLVYQKMGDPKWKKFQEQHQLKMETPETLKNKIRALVKRNERLF